MRRSVRALGMALVGAVALAACAPEGPTVEPIDPLEPRTRQRLVFRDPQECRDCHPEHVRDWEGSMHAYAMVDPVFHALADLVASDFEGQAGQLCTQCHSVPGFLGNETVVSRAPDGQFEQRTEGLSPVAQAGVSCDVCHQIAEVLAPQNANIRLVPDGTVRGPFADPQPNAFHASIESPLHRSGEVCTGCHAFVLPIVGREVPLETTAHEWRDEYLAGGGERSCQDCHMVAREGRAAVDGPMRTIHAHTFEAVDIALVDFPDRERQRGLVEALLRTAVEMDVTVMADPLRAEVGLRNLAGHAVPSGVTVERRMWVELQLVRDEGGEVIWSTGVVATDEDLPDGIDERPNDPALWWFGTLALDTERPGVPPEVIELGHRASAVETRLLRPHERQTRTIEVPLAPAAGAYTLRARLLMRPMQPHLLRTLERLRVRPLAPGLIEQLPIFEMAAREVAVVVP
ncbi:MAG: cytochrome c family protein [Myxococcota bacterium]|nr:cytochrome c family protein [Myxococcota bacterium]